MGCVMLNMAHISVCMLNMYDAEHGSYLRVHGLYDAEHGSYLGVRGLCDLNMARVYVHMGCVIAEHSSSACAGVV